MKNDFNNLLSVIKIAGKIEGRKKLQKVVYILKYLGVGFSENFSYHYYGPYSHEIQMEVNLLVEAGKILEDENHQGAAVSYTYSVEEEYAKRVDTTQLHKFESLINAMNGQQSTLLEVLATRLYLEEEGYEDVKEKVTILKPHLMDKYEDTERLYSEIKKIA